MTAELVAAEAALLRAFSGQRDDDPGDPLFAAVSAAGAALWEGDRREAGDRYLPKPLGSGAKARKRRRVGPGLF